MSHVSNVSACCGREDGQSETCSRVEQDEKGESGAMSVDEDDKPKPIRGLAVDETWSSRVWGVCSMRLCRVTCVGGVTKGNPPWKIVWSQVGSGSKVVQVAADVVAFLGSGG